MKKFHAALGLTSFLAMAGAVALAPAAGAQPVAETTYVACNAFGDCWRVHKLYAYGDAAPITYYNGDWYTAHQSDTKIHWLADPSDDRGYYDRDAHWHPDPAGRVVAGGAVGAGLGAAVGCLVTLPVGCAPGAAVGAAVGGGVGVVGGAASTPR